MFNFILGPLTRWLSLGTFTKWLAVVTTIFLGLLGVYLYSHYKGYEEASSECQTSTLQSEIDAKNIEINNLQKQIDDGTQTISDLNDKKNKVITIVKKVQTVIQNEVKDNPSCDVPSDVISMFNETRASPRSN